MRISLKTIAALLLLAASSRDAVADEVLDLEIRIGDVMPYTGELAPFGDHRPDGSGLFRHDQRARWHQRPQGQVHVL